MGRSPKTTEFLKECMADALLRLMREQSFEKISIARIVETAGVGRSTWFRHFDTKTDALTFWVTRKWYRWAEEHGIDEMRRYSPDNAAQFFQFNYELRQALVTIYSAGLPTVIYDAFNQVMAHQFGDQIDERYWRCFFSYGLFGLLEEWIKRDFAESPEEMTAIFRRMMGHPGMKDEWR